MRRLQSTKKSRVQALRNNRYLKGLDDSVMDILAGQTHLLAYDPEESIIHEGQTGPGLFIIESGCVKIFKGSPSGRQMIINVLEGGDSFNEVPVFDEEENPANVTAVFETRVWLIEAERLREVIAAHPGAARQIIINLSKNLRMLISKVAEQSFYTVTARLARLLRELPESQLNGTGSARLTQDELAARVGTVREVVARSLKELENRGAIELQRGKIYLRDLEILNHWDQ